MVENFVYFTVLGCTEHSDTTVGNVTRHLTVNKAEFSSKTYEQFQKYPLENLIVAPVILIIIIIIIIYIYISAITHHSQSH